MEANARTKRTLLKMEPGRKLWICGFFSGRGIYNERKPVFFVGFVPFHWSIAICDTVGAKTDDAYYNVADIFLTRKAMLRAEVPRAADVLERARTQVEELEAQLAKMKKEAK